MLRNLEEVVLFLVIKLKNVPPKKVDITMLHWRLPKFWCVIL